MAVVWEVTGGRASRVHVKELLHGLFCGDEGDRSWTGLMLKGYFQRAVDRRDASFLEYVGRNIPVKGDPPPKKPAKVKIAEYLRYCVVGLLIRISSWFVSAALFTFRFLGSLWQPSEATPVSFARHYR